MKKMGCALLLLFCATTLHAQEFSLHVKCFINDTLYSHPVIFGYDPAATDSYDGTKWFASEFPGGEQEYPPAGPGQDVDFMMGGQALNRFYRCPIDIRNKPSGASFELPFEIDLLANGVTSARLTWDSSLIPQIVRHIFLRSSYFNTFRLDMKKTSAFVLPLKDSAGLYDGNGKIVLDLLYNQDSLAVQGQNTISSVSIYPTLISEHQTMSLLLDQPRSVHIHIFDLLGREANVISLNCDAGVNQFSFPHTSSGAYIVEVRDENGRSLLIRQKIVVAR